MILRILGTSLFLGGMLFLRLIFAAETALPLQTVSIDIHDKERLQRGARMFMNYCSGCHSLQYMRYNRMAKDLGLTSFDGEVDEDLLKNNLIFTRSMIHDPIRIAMPEDDAKQWFGMPPPDLSLSARNRGATWIYHYLKSFYHDEKRPFGANNLLFPDVAMPNVLEPLLGKTILVQDKESPYILLVGQGEMYPAQFDSALQDLVTFLVYVGEPAQLIRYRLGVFVIGFLFLLCLVAFALKRAYWRGLK